MRQIDPVHARRDAAYRLPRISLVKLIMEYMYTLLAVIVGFVFFLYLLFEVLMSRVTWDLDRTIIMVPMFVAFFGFILKCYQPTADKLIALPDDIRDRVHVGFASRLSNVVMVMSYVVLALDASTACMVFYAAFSSLCV